MPLRRRRSATARRARARRDLGRHPGQGRRRRPRPLPRRRSRAQRIDEEVEVVVVDSGSRDGSAERARARGARVHAIPPSEFHHGRTRNLGAQLARGETLVFTSQDAVRRRRRVARDAHGAARAAARRRGRRTGGSCRTRTPRPPERYFLDFLYGPEPRVQRLASRRGAELRGDALLERELGGPALGAGSRFPFARRHRHERGPGVVAPRPPRGLAIVYEPQAAVHHSHAYSVGARCGGSSTRACRRSASYVDGRRDRRRRSGGGRPVRAGRDRRGSGRRDSGAGSRTRPSTSSRSSPGSSSGAGIDRLPRALVRRLALTLAGSSEGARR